MRRRARLLATGVGVLGLVAMHAPHSAAQSWTDPVDLATPLPRFDQSGADEPPGIVTNRRGDALVFWLRHQGTFTRCCDGNRVMVSFRPAGGRFETPRPISALGDDPSGVTAALTEDGGVTAAWTINELEADLRVTRPRIGFAVRPAGGLFQPGRLLLGAGGLGAMNPQLASTPGGDTVMVWEEATRDGPFSLLAPLRVRGALLGGNGYFGPAQTISDKNSRIRPGPGYGFLRDPMLGAVGVGPRGEVLAPWVRADGATRECCAALELAVRRAGAAFDAAQRISEGTGADGIGGWRVARDGDRGTLLLWLREVRGEQEPRAELRYRTADGELGPVERLETRGAQEVPDVEMHSDGTAEAVWAVKDQLWRAIRPPGGTFGTPEPVASPGGDPDLPVHGPQLALLADDSLLLVWERATRMDCNKADCRPGGYVIESGVLPRSGALQPHGRIAPADADFPTLAQVETGVIGLWTRGSGPQAAGFGVSLAPPPRGSTKQPRIAHPAITGCGAAAVRADCRRSHRPAFAFSLSGPASVAVRLCECNDDDLGRSIRVLRASGVKGANRVPIPGPIWRAMRPGRYTVALLAENSLGNQAPLVRTLVLRLDTRGTRAGRSATSRR